MATLVEQTLNSLENKKSGFQWFLTQESADYQILLSNAVDARFLATGNQSRSYKLAKSALESHTKNITEAPALIAEVDALIADINDTPAGQA